MRLSYESGTLPRSWATCVCGLGSLLAAHAGELKVDINRDSKNLDQYTEIGYTKWSQDTTGGATTGTAAATKVFTSASGETVSVSFSQTATSASRGGTGLLTNLYQVGAQNGARLVSDGFTVAPATLSTGGQIQMTVTGLSAGHHTLLTYHNHWDALAAGSLGPIDISLNGTAVRIRATCRLQRRTRIESQRIHRELLNRRKLHILHPLKLSLGVLLRGHEQRFGVGRLRSRQHEGRGRQRRLRVGATCRTRGDRARNQRRGFS